MNCVANEFLSSFFKVYVSKIATTTSSIRWYSPTPNGNWNKLNSIMVTTPFIQFCQLLFQVETMELVAPITGGAEAMDM